MWCIHSRMVTILKRREPSTTPRILDGVRDAIQIWQCHHNGGTSGNMLIWIIYRQYLHIGQIDCLFKQLRRTNSLLPQIKCQNTTYALSLAQPASSFSCEFCMGWSSAYLVGDFSPYDEPPHYQNLPSRRSKCCCVHSDARPQKNAEYSHLST